MLKAIRDFFNQHVTTASDPPGDPRSIQLATAALLVEAMRSDGAAPEAERAAVLRAVREKFGLGGTEAATLIELAEREVGQASDYFQFTSLINREFTQEQKQRVIELMWQVAYADEVLSAHELHLMRRIAGLLHIPDSAYIAAKLRAKELAQQK